MANVTNSKKESVFFVRNNDFCSDIHYETHLELNYQLSKSFCPNVDLGELWLKDAIPCPPASEYWRALEGNGNYSVEDTFTPKLRVSLGPLK